MERSTVSVEWRAGPGAPPGMQVSRGGAGLRSRVFVRACECTKARLNECARSEPPCPRHSCHAALRCAAAWRMMAAATRWCGRRRTCLLQWPPWAVTRRGCTPRDGSPLCASWRWVHVLGGKEADGAAQGGDPAAHSSPCCRSVDSVASHLLHACYAPHVAFMHHPVAPLHHSLWTNSHSRS